MGRTCTRSAASGWQAYEMLYEIFAAGLQTAAIVQHPGNKHSNTLRHIARFYTTVLGTDVNTAALNSAQHHILLQATAPALTLR